MRYVISLLAALFAAALRVVTRKRATSVPTSDVPPYVMTPEEAAYWALSDAERAAEDAEYEDQLLRSQLYLEWLEECEYEERLREEELALRDEEDQYDDQDEDDEYTRQCEQRDLEEIEFLASEHCPDDRWKYDHLGDEPLA